MPGGGTHLSNTTEINTVHHDGLVAVQKHTFHCSQETLALQLVPEVEIKDGANLVVAPVEAARTAQQGHGPHVEERHDEDGERGREEVRGVRLFLLFFLFPLGRRGCLARLLVGEGAAPTMGPLFASSRSALSCASFNFLACSLSFSSSSFFLQLELSQEEVLDRGVVHAVSAAKRRHREERSPGSHVTARGCRTLRPGHLRRRRRPHPPEVESSVAVARCTSRAPPPSWALAVFGPRGGGVVRSFSQGHSDGHPLVAMPLTEPSLSPPHCGARSSVFAMHQHVDHYKARKINKMRQPCLSLEAVVVVVVVVVVVEVVVVVVVVWFLAFIQGHARLRGACRVHAPN